MPSDTVQKLGNFVPTLIAVAMVCGYLFYVLFVNLIAISSPDQAIDKITVDGIQYVLSCKPTMDGPVDLFLYECEDSSEESCVIVEQNGIGGYNCQDGFELQIRDGTVQALLPDVSDPHAIMSYNPGQ